ncbi:hypothetical protein Q8A67_021733 [Cirrhinus molitorella]|uniref:Uncharacterized protein n=1 Tax=Cirrhinus molitorella TaxID=172907 RepID=A0AA88PBA5_9TELE|nr:hypothetical protein Q8A67_021733 [Cirrhinus molitorella]
MRDRYQKISHKEDPEVLSPEVQEVLGLVVPKDLSPAVPEPVPEVPSLEVPEALGLVVIGHLSVVVPELAPEDPTSVVPKVPEGLNDGPDGLRAKSSKSGGPRGLESSEPSGPKLLIPKCPKSRTQRLVSISTGFSIVFCSAGSPEVLFSDLSSIEVCICLGLHLHQLYFCLIDPTLVNGPLGSTVVFLSSGSFALAPDTLDIFL